MTSKDQPKAHLTYAFSEDERFIHFKTEHPVYGWVTLLYEAESYGKIDTYLLTNTTPSVRNLPLSPEGNVVTIYVASHLDQAYCGGIWHLDWSETDQH